MRTTHLLAAWFVVAVCACLFPARPALAVGTVEVQTVPPTPGMALLIDDQEVVTGANGRAEAQVADVGAASVGSVKRYSRVDNGVRAKIGAVDGSGSSRTLRLELEYRTGFTFATIDGEPIGNDRIERINLRSSTGTVKTFQPAGPIWLQGLRVAPLNGVPTPKDIWWNVDDVKVRDTSVVNRSQQRFEPSTMRGNDRTVAVELLFFDARVRVRDAFFGSPVSGQLVVQHPDGSTERHPLDADGTVNLGDVPRGQYEMAVEGDGLRIPRPMTITRDVNDELRFYSWLDVGLAAAFILVFLWGLVAVGARRRRSQRRAARRHAIQQRTAGGLNPERRVDGDANDQWLGVEKRV